MFQAADVLPSGSKPPLAAPIAGARTPSPGVQLVSPLSVEFTCITGCILWTLKVCLSHQPRLSRYRKSGSPPPQSQPMTCCGDLYVCFLLRLG